MYTKDPKRQLLQNLSKTLVVQRLKHIDLSAVPRWLAPQVSTASRYQHVVGVGQLSLLVSHETEHDTLLLTAAAVLHDVGNGPFPHISDPIMEDVLGFRHEKALSFAFRRSPSEDASILEDYGLYLNEVASVIEGRHRLSPFLNAQPDLDNADNIHRFMVTTPGKPLGEPAYQPQEIANSIELGTSETRIPDDLRKRWMGDREKVYRHLWDNELNMVGWTMLGRALRILKEELSPGFFLLTNRKAFHLIRLKIPGLAEGLRLRKYRILLGRRYHSLNGEAKRLSRHAELQRLEDEICQEIGLEKWAMGLAADQPLLRDKPEYWRVYVVALEHVEKLKNLKSIVEDVLSESTPFIC